MREIRFRGRDLENDNQWRYGSLIQYPHGECVIVVTDSDVKELSYEVDPDTVGQDTGLKDINGTDIYEGDILQVTLDELADDRTPVKVVGNTTAGFLLEDDYSLYSYLADIFINEEKYVVIGNIHDNPELMEGGDK